MKYIINTASGCTVFNQKEETYFITQLTFIKKLCEKHLFTLEGYLKSVKKHLKISYKIPIVINESLILFSTQAFRDYENIWINYANIEKTIFFKNQTKIIFFDKTELTIKITEEQYANIVHKINEIRHYKLSLK
ncbi:MAG: hypothetical protein GX312_01085 [Candidatus Phytoplasma sp.]|nr:hypothetical protein [Phytoplasma sp.]